MEHKTVIKIKFLSLIGQVLKICYFCNRILKNTFVYFCVYTFLFLKKNSQNL